jgi:hypothetical protein
MLYSTATINAFTTKLAAAITASSATISLVTSYGLRTNGILVIDRVDSDENLTPTKREYISFTARSGDVISGVTRGLSNSSPLSHALSAVVDDVFTVHHWDSLASHLVLEHSSIGIHVLNNPTISYLETKNVALSSVVSLTGTYIGSPTITTVNTASMSFPWSGQFIWSWGGTLATMLTSLASYQIPMIRTMRNYTIKDMYAAVISPPSTTALQLDISYRSTPTGTLTSIFSTKPTIDAGEFETLTAATPYALNLTSLASGILLAPEIEAPSNGGDLMMSLIVQERP